MFGVFRVKNHDFTPKNHIFPILGGGGARNFWGISCEKSRFYTKKIIFFPILGGGHAPGAPPPPPPESAPAVTHVICEKKISEFSAYNKNNSSHVEMLNFESLAILRTR
jgi:hypothetical protein